MSELHEEPKSSSLSALILIATILLAILYFLAKGCTNVSENTNSSLHSSAAIYRVIDGVNGQS